MSARTAYDAYRVALFVVALGIALAAMVGRLDSPVGGPTLPQYGTVVQGQSPVDHFNDDVKIDTTQVRSK